MEIPSAHFGRKVSRVVPDAIVRVELRLSAPIVTKLSAELSGAWVFHVACDDTVAF